MALSKLLFPIIRALQLLTLIPIWGMLAWFVHQYDRDSQPIPAEILVLFIASLVGTAWGLVSFFQFHHSIGISILVFVMDMVILGGLIAGVVFLRRIRNQECTAVSVPFQISWGDYYLTWDNGNGWDISFRKSCMMLKSAWALGIVNCVLFFITALLALFIYRRNERVAVREKGYVVDDRRPVRRGRWI
ncbi:hypothetical protein EV426DRAFT_206771 [Tirmania nivea]|nr:hypothetical protein EV426DRAFT_206771 [Tirmania nivea]